MAKKETEAASEAKEQMANQTAAEEMATVKLFKDNERYKDDVFVAVNGRRWQIRRGEAVEVPKYIADVLEQSMQQDARTAGMIERKSTEFKRESERLGA